jgi:hypothetical protein
MTPRQSKWDALDWAALDRLRDTFLAGKPGGTSYWTSRLDLENYNFTFAQRIAWKWDAVLDELKLRGWTPPSGPLLDWGCGSGIAGRRVVEFFGTDRFQSILLFDRAPLAMEFAAEQARKRFPSLRVAFGQSPTHAPPASEIVEPRIGTLVVSHVINELDAAGGRALRQAIEQSGAVLWVEPGTYADSRSLIELRESFRQSFQVIAPCTHQATCGLCAPGNERHWCHHFAQPPANIMADSNWVRFAQRVGIDLRSLPYSFLVLERKGLRQPIPGLLPEVFSRIIGTPRSYKGYAKIFSCQADGVRDLTLQKRDAPELFKALKSGQASPLHRWELSGDRIQRVAASSE